MANDKLTTEETARVFAMYYGQRVLKFSKTAPATQIMDVYMLGRVVNDIQDKYITLTPLSKITDEDAIEVANFAFTESLNNSDKIIIGNDFVKYKYLNEGISNSKVSDVEELSDYSIFIFQYLISKGYAVPLWFGVDHWANGKNALELGIAIEKQK